MNPQTDRSFFGHPRGLSTLFFTEMWERYGYYGMRSLLILYLTASGDSGGMGLSVAQAGGVYGLFTAMAYMSSLPGGWIADRFLGQRKAVLYGGILIALGYWMLAASSQVVFFSGMAVVVIGTGLLKPNISTIVGQIYSPADVRRDSGFSIFYMGINLGAFLAPLISGYIGEKINWHLGFALSGLGMSLGVVQYWWGQRHFGDAGLHPVPPRDPAEARQNRLWLRLGGLGLLACLAALWLLPIETLVNITGLLLFGIVGALFAWLLFGKEWSTEERKRMAVVFVLFLAACLFWSAFEQAGSSLNLFARNSTELSFAGINFTASQLQAANAFFIVVLSGAFAWLWLRLGTRQPSSPTKFAIGLILAGLGYVVLIGPAHVAATGVRVTPLFLILTYLLHTMGELCLSPVGLSAMTKLAPARVGGLIMGVWFISISIGNYLGGRLASFYGEVPVPTLFTIAASFALGAGVIMALVARPVARMMGDAK